MTAWTMTFDATHPVPLAEFWRFALGYVEAAPPKGFASWEQWYSRFDIPPEERGDVAALEDPEGLGPRISFLKVPEPKTAKNRLHIDLQVGGGRGVPLSIRWPLVMARVDQLTAAGATVLEEQTLEDGTLDHIVMADPEGNEFCVL